MSQQVVKAESVFYYVPSPIETADLLKKAGATYDKDLLNPIENVSKYSSAAARALNMGVYGADLSFTGIFDQHTESSLYLQCTNKLAQALSISGAFGPEVRDRLEANATNRDSILNIITDAYWDCDAILQQNKQYNVSALMITGGWIEGCYLACKIADATKNKTIRTRVVEQRHSLDNLVALLQTKYTESGNKDQDIGPVLTDLKAIQASFAKITPASKETPTATDDKNKVTVIGDDSAGPEVSDAVFTEILGEIVALRGKIISKT